MTNLEVQNIAKQTMAFLKTQIKVGMPLKELRAIAENKMFELGATSFWYWDIGAFVFCGNETTLSVSGKAYKTADRTIAENDIITVDLSPQADNIWGDYARTIIIENGAVVDSAQNIKNAEWKDGLLFEERLHKELFSFAKPETTFEELYFYVNNVIQNSGYLNLDFMGNLGHSIETEKQKRIYIERGNKTNLGSVQYFTFEPHVSKPNSKYGYKHENIYYLNKNRLQEL